MTVKKYINFTIRKSEYYKNVYLEHPCYSAEVVDVCPQKNSRISRRSQREITPTLVKGGNQTMATCNLMLY